MRHLKPYNYKQKMIVKLSDAIKKGGPEESWQRQRYKEEQMNRTYQERKKSDT